ncbi:hypothetical protein COCOBI_15-3130 [Coccomyxa sp. Obi]|nr:hypothetical protein COCOBI_15-3130 [Coccomyxa sp. Obi]
MGARSTKQQVEVREVDAGCCACFGKVVCSIILAIVLLIVAALSAVAVAVCRYQFWTYLQDNSVSPAYVLRTGWYEFTRTASNFNITSASSQLSNVTNAVDQAVSAFQSTKSSLVAGGNPSLKDISNDLWIIGVIAAAALVLSCVMSLIYFLFSLCGGAGSHICCAAVPVGIIVLGMQVAYYGAAVIKVRDYTFNTTNGHTYTPIPDWGWILGAVAGVLWLIIAGISACVPSMRRKEKVVVQQPMGTISGQGPPGPGAPARYANIDPERGTARPRGRAY